MHGLSHLYHLSFISNRGRRGTASCIAFTLDATHRADIESHLRFYYDNNREHAKGYLETDDDLTISEPDLFGHVRFGYGACGLLVQDDTQMTLYVALGQGIRLRYAALTIHALARTLFSLTKPGDGSFGMPQCVTFTTRCERDEPYYAHAMSGRISGAFLSWLKAQHLKASERMFGASVPERVVQAMRETWCSVAREEHHEWARECRGHIYEDGRFMLACMGNACDIAIYPESLRGDSEDADVQFDCHNLDSARQQMTLLAGLATLAELSRSPE